MRVPIGAALVVLPAIAFYATLFRKAVEIPFQDDYGALLYFLNNLAQRQGMAAKLNWFLATQDNEYKLFLGHAIAWLQFALLGHVNIRLLCAVGNAVVLLLAWLLWTMFLPQHRDLGDRLMLFVPASWALFQLQYAETLNWAMPGLQNLPVLLFSFCAIYLLLQTGRWPFAGACVCFVLAVAASGNGFLLIPIGLLILFRSRRYAGIAGWLVLSAACVAAYAYGYHAAPSQKRPHPIYVITFLGNFASTPFAGHSERLEIAASLLAGTLLIAFVIFLWRSGYARRNPAVSYCVLFLLLTAVGVAGIRSDFGLVQSLSSRYSIYSILFLIFAWFAFAEEFLLHENGSWLRRKALPAMIVVMVLFSVVMDRRGWLFLSGRDATLIEGMTAFERPGSSQGPVLRKDGQGPGFNSLVARAPGILRESMRLGIYEPPAY